MLEDISLSSVPLFKSPPADELAHLLKSYKIWDAPAGALILEEGQPGEGVKPPPRSYANGLARRRRSSPTMLARPNCARFSCPARKCS